jgi:hypothetical protein
MRAAVSNFAGKVAAKGPDTVALVFYAGHGIQVDGENFLIPTDIDPKREADIPMQAVRLNDVLNTLASVPSKMRFLLLDSCRNNPSPNLARAAAAGSPSSTPRSALPAPSCRFRPHPARSPRTATASTARTRRRWSKLPSRRTFRSRKPSSACVLPSTRQPTAGRRLGIPRR